MHLQLAKRCEFNALGADVNVQWMTQFALKQGFSAVVTLPEYIPYFASARAANNGSYKIIAAIDWPDGKNLSLSKFKTLSNDFLAADGFDIIVTPGRTEIETKNEVTFVSNFLKRQLSKLVELRWSIEALTRDPEEVTRYLKIFKKTPPSMVRIDHHLSLPHRDDIDEISTRVAEQVLRETTAKVKISTNVTYPLMKKFEGNNRVLFDVSHDTALTIGKAYNDELTAARQKQAESQEEPQQEVVQREKA